MYSSMVIQNKMKQLLLMSFMLLYHTASDAQTETFDLATYSIPEGWDKIKNSNDLVGYVITNNKTGTYCQVAVYKSINSMGSAQLDFETEWQDLVAKTYHVTDKPEFEQGITVDGWESISGAAKFEFSGGESLVMMVTKSGYGRRLSILILTNTTDYQSEIQQFLESVDLNKPKENTPLTSEVQENTNTPNIIGSWGKNSSVVSNSFYSNMGYSKDQYTFNDDGTYFFASKIFQSSYDKILLVREHGTYQVNGTNLTISPLKSVIESWSKKGGTDKFGALLSTQNRTLEKITYQFTMYLFTGIQEWNMVLQAGGQRTQRDGLFGTNSTFEKAWYYRPISTSNTAIEVPVE